MEDEDEDGEDAGMLVDGWTGDGGGCGRLSA